MSTGLLTLLLFIPFIVAIAVVAPIYLRSGYKRGIWRALISLGATVAAIFVSIFLANIIAGSLSTVVSESIAAESFESLGIMRGVVKSLLTGIVQDGLALTLFGFCFLVCLIVFKIIVNHVCPNKLKTDKKVFKWSGFGVRAVDAVLVAVLILVPIYGTIATYVTPVAKLARFADEKNSQIVMMLGETADHPMVGLYRFGPAKWVYRGLSGFKVGDATVDLPKIADTVDITMQKLEKFKNAEGDDRIQAAKELTQHLRSNVVEEDWFYEIAKETSLELKKEIEAAVSPEDAKEAEMYLDLFSASKEDFLDSATIMLDFFSYAMDSEFMDFTESGDYTVLTPEFHDELADMLNHSSQTISLKKMTLVSAAEILFRTQYQAMGMSADEQTITNAATEFVEQYWNDGQISADCEDAEAEAIMILYYETKPLNILDGFARHPLFGYEAVAQFVTDEFLAESLAVEADVAQIRMILEENPAIRQDVIAHLQACETAPLHSEMLDEHVFNAVKNAIQ